jgi:hypothetical protein
VCLSLRSMEKLSLDQSDWISVAFRIVLVNYTVILFIEGSFRPLSVKEIMWAHFLSTSEQRFGFAVLAAA